MAKSVRVYSAQACPYCHLLIEFLKENDVAFENADIEKDRKAFRELREKSGQEAVPVIDIDGVMIIGYDRKKIADALGIK